MHVGVRYHYYSCNFYFSPIITIPQDRGAGAGGAGAGGQEQGGRSRGAGRTSLA